MWKNMDDKPHHECGFAMLRLLKPLEYYEEKYGTSFFGLNRMYLMMEKQRNRGQDGCGIANVKLDVPPGVKYMSCEKSIDKDPIKDVFERVQKTAHEKQSRAPANARVQSVDGGHSRVDPAWSKENVPFYGEVFLGHVRYGTDSDNSLDRCHPVLRESNWMTRSLLLAGNFNITNNEDLFTSLVQIGQHPRELSDTVTLLEKIGHFVDKENNDLYVKYSATGQAPRTCFSLIAENINVARILRRASGDWDGGYCIAGMLGHGDAFVMRDPSGIRPAFYVANDEVIVIASEAPLIQTVFEVKEDQVHPLPPGQALIIKRSGKWSLERILPARELKQCQFERIYFSRGNDAGVYHEREELGRKLLKPLLNQLEAEGDSLANTVLSFIPNTSELSFNGLVKEAQDEMARRRVELLTQLQSSTGADVQCAIEKLSSMIVRTEKVVHKDAKIRTFIQEDSSREHMTVHAYDVHYGTVRAGQDVLVALDDSIVRGNTLKNAILRTLDRLGPKRILILSAAPQIRYPDVYGIDMAKMGDLAAFKAAIKLLEERGRADVITEVYRACRTQLSKPLTDGEFVNHVQRIYEPFTAEEISRKIVQQVTPEDCKAKIDVLFNTVEAVHESMPDFAGDWYFTGNYPTPGGTKVCCRAFVLWMEGSSSRCYGVNSALSTTQTSVLVVGHGGSEHAIAWKLSQSHEVGCVYVAPGNGGTVGHQAVSGARIDAGRSESHAPLVPIDVPLAAPSFREIALFCKERSVALVVVGSEQFLAEGLADVLRSSGVPVFGPSQAAAEVESSTLYSQGFTQRHNVRTVDLPCNEALLEEWPRDRHVSVLAFSDGFGFSVLPIAVQEHRWSLDEERGQITDGMGSYAPSPLVDEEMLSLIEKGVIEPLFVGLKREDRPFVGCLQAELVLMHTGPKVFRVRCCLGEPTAQTVMPLLEGDLFEFLYACAEGRLGENKLRVSLDTSAVAVVMASGGYPGPWRRGHAVTGLERALCVPGAHVFHSGTNVQQTSTAAVPKTAPRRGLPAPQQSHRITTWGGRVLTVCAVGRGLNEARERAYVGVRSIRFNDSWYRHDIAALAAMNPGARPKAPPTKSEALTSPAQEFTYRAAGVDRSACEAALASFAPLMKRTVPKTFKGKENSKTAQANSKDDSALRGKLCDVAIANDKVLISSTNTVGTKLRIAAQSGTFEGIGNDLVALCVNDLAARGAEPLFFHEHTSADKVDAHTAIQLVKGCSDGCLEAGCMLLDTGIAELPGIFTKAGMDFVGFAVGQAPRDGLLPRSNDMIEGDVVIAMPASGLHSNGFSLVRAIIRAAGLEYSHAAPFDPTRSLGEALLAPARIYVQPLLALARAGVLRGASAVASGGLERCFDSVLPAHLAAHLRAECWELPTALRWLAGIGKIKCGELASTFNCGLGVLLIVSSADKDVALKLLHEHQEEPLVVGELVSRQPGTAQLEVEGAEGTWLMLPELGVSLPFPEVLSSLRDPWAFTRRRVFVLAGREEVTPLQALVQAFALPASSAFLVAVASAHKESSALTIARSSGVKDVVLGDGRFSVTDFYCEGLDEGLVARGADIAGGAPITDLSPAHSEAGSVGVDGNGDALAAADFSAHLAKAMESSQAELLVLLDDVDTTLITRAFLSAHTGRVLVVHAALLPAFPGPAPIEAALRADVCVTGCTVCFATPPASFGGAASRCCGPQILQEVTRVMPNDSSATLRARVVEECEATAVARAVQLAASGAVVLRRDENGFGLGRSSSFTEVTAMKHHQ